jgi:hypothetical protein
MEQPEVGDIAVCARGHIGMVTKIVWKYDRKGRHRRLWKGVHLDHDDAGKPWESRAPEKLLTPGDYLS